VLAPFSNLLRLDSPALGDRLCFGLIFPLPFPEARNVLGEFRVRKYLLSPLTL
jgi:hypothetical protein